MVVVRLLGEVAVTVDGRPAPLGPARQRCVLAVLAVDANRVVPVDRLVARVWGAEVARRAPATVHSYISRLRRALAEVDGVTIVRRSGGYALMTSAVDLHRFRDLHARARRHEGTEEAMRALTEALSLWHGEALTGLSGEWVDTERERLERERLAAQHDLVDARLHVGHGDALVAELADRAADHPLDERVAGQYLLALFRAGRAADAQEHYRRLRDRLVDELGTDPGPALQELHQRILEADPGLATLHPDVRSARTTVPRQLPAAPTSFVGRGDELARLDAAVRDAPAAATVVISAIAGAGGIGKTWLAVHWAHRNADRFPDGQLFVDLRGFSPDGTPMDPAVAVRGFLDTLDVDPTRAPADPHAQAALLRSLLTGRRMLVVLDNAADTTQVVPLLPGSPTCTVLVTSRTRLSGLTTGYAARHVPLDVLSDTEAHSLLTDRLGAARVAAEPTAVDALVRLCGGFPLALSIVAGHAHTHPDIALSAFAAELRELGLDALDDEDPTASLPAVLSWSRRALTPEQTIAFALLGIVPGTDTGLPVAAALTGLAPARARLVLRGLERASLITRDAADRYRMHDLIRAYAVTTARDELTDDVRDAALHRVLDFYTRTAHAADCLLSPHRQPIPPDPPVPAVPDHPLADDPAAMDWLAREHGNLLAAVNTAADLGRHRVVWRLAWALSTFHIRRGHLNERIAVWGAALTAAPHLDDLAAHALAHRFLGRAHADVEHHDEAIHHLRQALTLSERQGDRDQQAHTHHDLARALEQQGIDDLAVDHAIRALDLYRTSGRPVWEADALNQVGWLAARLGRYDTARTHCSAALHLHREHGNPGGEAATLDSLGYVEHHNGHHDHAVNHYQRALALLRKLGDTYQEAQTAEALGHPLIALGRTARAREVWRQARELYRQQGRDAEGQRVGERLDALDS